MNVFLTALILLFASIGAVKVIDTAFSLAWATKVANRRESDTPVFRWIDARPAKIKTVLGILFRSPVIALALGALITFSVGVSDWINLSGAITCVGVASVPLVCFLWILIFRRSGSDPLAWSGFFPTRPPKDGQPEDPLHPVVVVGAIALSILFAYSALYRSIFLLAPQALSSGSRTFSGVDAMFFSSMVSTTVGIGNVRPSSQASELAVASQALMAVTALSMLISGLAEYTAVPMSKVKKQA